jgi:hypothetical protein
MSVIAMSASCHKRTYCAHSRTFWVLSRHRKGKYRCPLYLPKAKEMLVPKRTLGCSMPIRRQAVLTSMLKAALA